MAPSSDNSSTMMLSPKKTVTFAVNYQKSMLDQFCLSTASPRSVKQSSALAVELVENSTAAPDDINPTRSSASATQRDFAPDGMENSAPNTPLPNNNKKTMNSIPNDKTVTATSNDDNMNNNNNNKNVSIKTPTTERQRRSTRELKKKEATMERARVRYDVQLVPSVKRNRAFLDRFPLWMVPPPTPEEKMKVMQHRQQQIQKEQQQQLIAAQQKQEAAKQHKLIEDDKAALQDVEEVSTKSTTGSSVSADPNAPFAEDTSVVWIPKKRSEWEDCVQEMTAVCTSASLRRHMATGGRSSSSKPFYQPLSLAYLKDRIDIGKMLFCFISFIFVSLCV